MSFFEKILYALEATMPRPQMYSLFHILFLVATIGVSIFIAHRARVRGKDGTDRILLAFSIVCIILEIYKQIIFSFNWTGTEVVWAYQWYAFPFQFCSTPMYVALVAALCREGRFKNALYVFLGTYGLVAGLSVMLYPSTVFIETIGINIQTMVHHGSQVIMGVAALSSRKLQFDLRDLLSGLYVFAALSAVALAIDVATYYLGIDGGLEMFFISPFHVSTLPILSIVYTLVPYPVFLLAYFFAFTLGSYLVLCVSRGIRALYRKKRPLEPEVQ